MRVPWTARTSNQSILVEPTLNIHWKVLKLKLRYFGYLMETANSLRKTLMKEKLEGRKRGGDRG